MSLLRLVYFSHNRLGGDAAARADQMADLLSASIANNRQRGITGAMIHDDRWIVQVLEGPPPEVMATCVRIAADPRHADMVVADTVDTEERRFPYWWMAGAAVDPGMTDVLRRHGASDTLDPRRLSGNELVDLAEAVVTAFMARSPRAGAMAHA